MAAMFRRQKIKSIFTCEANDVVPANNLANKNDPTNQCLCKGGVLKRPVLVVGSETYSATPGSKKNLQKRTVGADNLTPIVAKSGPNETQKRPQALGT